MHNLKINIGNKDYNFTHPERFNELSENQYMEIVRLFFLPKENLTKRIDDQLRLLFVLLGGLDIKRKNRKSILQVLESIINDDSDYSFQLIALQNFLYTDKDFSTWKIPTIKIGKKLHNSQADDRFNSMTFGTFIQADILASAYFGAKKPEIILNKLVEVLYDCDDINGLDEVTKFAILYNYLAVRSYLTKRYTTVFTSEESSKKMSFILGKKENSWLQIRRTISGSVLNLEKTDKLNLHEVLSHLESEMNN